MADAISSGTCDLIGLGRAAVLEPDIPKRVLLNPATGDHEALARPHIVRGQWFSNLVPVEVVGSGLPIQFWYYNMKRLGRGLSPDPDKSIPGMLVSAVVEMGSGIGTDLVNGILGLLVWKWKVE